MCFSGSLHAYSPVAVPSIHTDDSSRITLAILISGIILLGYLWWRSKVALSKETPLEPLEGPIEDDPLEVSAWFEFLDKKIGRIPIRKNIVRIGRAQDNDLHLREPSIHSRHAIVQFTNDDIFVIADLSGHENYGTYVNDIRVKRTILYNNDVIKLGDVEARFRVKYHDVGQLHYRKSGAQRKEPGKERARAHQAA